MHFDHFSRKDPDWIELDELPALLAAACAVRDAYTETASMAAKLCKPKGGRKAKACFKHIMI